jgi:hypothetical protein
MRDVFPWMSFLNMSANGRAGRMAGIAARAALVLLGTGGLVACGATTEQLKARAAFDMGCPQDQIDLGDVPEPVEFVK